MFSLPNRCENCWPVQLSTGLYGYWKYDGTAAAARKDGESNTFRPAHTVPQLEPSLLWASLTRVYPICCPRRFAARREWRVFAWRRPVAAGVVSERLHRNVVKCSWHINSSAPSGLLESNLRTSSRVTLYFAYALKNIVFIDSNVFLPDLEFSTTKYVT